MRENGVWMRNCVARLCMNYVLWGGGCVVFENLVIHAVHREILRDIRILIIPCLSLASHQQQQEAFQLQTESSRKNQTLTIDAPFE